MPGDVKPSETGARGKVSYLTPTHSRSRHREHVKPDDRHPRAPPRQIADDDPRLPQVSMPARNSSTIRLNSSGRSK